MQSSVRTHTYVQGSATHGDAGKQEPRPAADDMPPRQSTATRSEQARQRDWPFVRMPNPQATAASSHHGQDPRIARTRTARTPHSHQQAIEDQQATHARKPRRKAKQHGPKRSRSPRPAGPAGSEDAPESPAGDQPRDHWRRSAADNSPITHHRAMVVYRVGSPLRYGRSTPADHLCGSRRSGLDRSRRRHDRPDR